MRWLLRKLAILWLQECRRLKLDGLREEAQRHADYPARKRAWESDLREIDRRLVNLRYKRPDARVYSHWLKGKP